jgi:hypothetical protein
MAGAAFFSQVIVQTVVIFMVLFKEDNLFPFILLFESKKLNDPD